MPDPKYLFDDDAVQKFIVDGYCVVKADFPKEFHDTIYKKTEDVFAKEGNPGNNLLPRIPEIQKVYDHPAVQGALISLLGSNYVMHTHRHPHINPPESKGGGWHKDSYWGYRKVRDHHPRWVMAMYYPQDVTIENGPTGIIPGTQYFESRVEDPDAEGIPMCGEAGSVIMIHFDLWHRAFPNQTRNNRYMMKFQFTRMDEPQGPTWRNARSAPALNGLAESPRAPMWTEVWNWLSGRHGVNGHRAGKKTVASLAEALEDASEDTRLHASYSLAALGKSAVPSLIRALHHEDDQIKRDACYGLGSIGAPAIPALLEALKGQDDQARGYAVYALGDMGPAAAPAVSALVNLADDPSEWVRRNLADALGNIARHPEQCVPVLIRFMKDEDGQVRFNTAYALGKFGADAQSAIPVLTEALYDDNRYVPGHASIALERIGTPEAVRVLVHLLNTSRWCPMTTKESTF